MATWQGRAKALMRLRGLTQADLIKPLGVTTRGAVGHYLSGRRQVNAGQLAALGELLGCSLDYLLKGDGWVDEPTDGLPDLPKARKTQARLAESEIIERELERYRSGLLEIDELRRRLRSILQLPTANNAQVEKTKGAPTVRGATRHERAIEALTVLRDALDERAAWGDLRNDDRG